VRREPGYCLTGIVWIVRPCAAYSVEIIMKCLDVLRANSLPFYVIKFHLMSEGEFEKESFHICN